MAFIAQEYGRAYAPNTRETFRRQVLHQFIQARIVDYNPDNPDSPTNSPHAHYALTTAALGAIRAYGTKRWKSAARAFVTRHGSLLTVYQRKRAKHLVPVRLPEGTELKLSPGKHNELQVAVTRMFRDYFAAGAQVLYPGDTAKKTLHIEAEQLAALDIPVTEHEKLPDIILHDEDRNRLFLIEAVTAHGPMTPKRVIELEAMFAKCEAQLIFVSAFQDFGEFRKHVREIAWETEVWIVEFPDHLIYYNGDKFLERA